MKLPVTDVRHPALLAADLRRFALRVEGLGYPVAQLEVAGGAHALLVDRGGACRAAILPAGYAALAEGELESTTRALRGLAPSRRLTLLAWGPPPGPTARRRLRDAGIELALYEPLEPGVLRFQVNRALGPGGRPSRRALRAPLEGEVAVRWRFRTRPARVYSMSASGAFILCDEPLRPGRRLQLEVPVGRLRPRTQARVVLSNPPAERIHADLPPGMAVAFESLDGASAAVIHRLVEERLATLAV
jgi:hypothetical protein